MYMSWVLGFMDPPPSPPWSGPWDELPQRMEYACPCMQMHAYAFV